MVETVGLRERKKQRTRQALVEAAMRLFQEKGYERTTVAEIADAAGVSTKTLFNYFPGKEELIFGHRRERVDSLRDRIAARGEGEQPADLLTRVVEELLTSIMATGDEPGFELNLEQARLIMAVPELRARSLQLLVDAQQRLAAALHAAYPDRYDPITAAATIGVLVGAMHAAMTASLARADSLEQTMLATRRAVEIARAGIGAN
ncbi:TetR/AcrR family transcriptional regulator [Amycolatopsis cihanbeyliensis]|uniref:TetR family transcriptional regulator n=1 Tax=Amycolatopsis cihanbeyliensis TaxID=1128664 RepID=A0A542CTS3_AMYCI|nr:TetR/AcrR family transcriptional regulator [Amycolatopsis cihanbeyliensis]TQI94221.1 TetR family transcriptional regulator [Amycolatopsis cihanbeyliensis]